MEFKRVASVACFIRMGERLLPSRDDHNSAAEQLCRLQRRHRRLRRLCRAMNRRRRVLRDKVDLLCHDLIGESRQFTDVLGRYRQICDFQHELIGEYDLLFLLHRSLCMLRENWPDAGGVVYLDDRSAPAAHIVGDAVPDAEATRQLESLLLQRVAAPVFAERKELFYPTTDWLPAAGDSERNTILSLIGLPLKTEEALVAAAVFYRSSDPGAPGFVPTDISLIRPYLPSLARAVVAAQRLQDMVALS